MNFFWLITWIGLYVKSLTLYETIDYIWRNKIYVMKRVFTFITASTLSLGAMAQQITTAPLINGDFEDWESAIAGNSQVGQEPVQWNSFMSASGGLNGQADRQVEPSPDRRPGSIGTTSARIWSRSILGVKANGNVTTGRINMGSISATDSDNHAYTMRSNSLFNHPMTSRPDSVVFWAKYNPTGNNGSYKARMNATIHDDVDYKDPEQSHQNGNRVAKATVNFTTTNGQWRRFSVPFDYNFPSNDPRYLLITFTTCETPGGCGASDELFVDDAELIYNKKVFANNDAYTINAGSSLFLTGANGILANDAVNYGLLGTSFTIVQNPASGQIIQTGPEEIRYLPANGWFGTDVFRYRVNHGDDASVYGEGIVTVTVNYVAPAEQIDVVASDDVAIIYPGVVGIVNVLANDFRHEDNEFDLSSMEIVVAPHHGTVEIDETGNIVYQSATSFLGSDSLQYRICDNQETPSCDTAWLRISSDFSSVDNTIFADLVLFTNNDQLFIQGSNLEGASYAIFTTTGALVQEGAVASAVNFNVSAGVYLVQITASNGETRKRIIKQ